MRANAPAEMERQSAWIASEPTTPNASLLLNGVFRSARRIVRTSSSVSASPAIPFAGRTRTESPSFDVSTFWTNESGTKTTLSLFCPRTFPRRVWRPITRSGKPWM